MPTKREIDKQIADLKAARETADDDEEMVEVYRVKKSALSWLFGKDDSAEDESEDEGDGTGDEPPKDEPKPKARTKYFGGQ
jgi:hypothetical protein